MKLLRLHLKHLITILCLSISATLFAYDFEVEPLYYNILSSDEKTVEVVGYPRDVYYEEIAAISIPSSVLYNGISYKVTSIGESVFWWCDNLTSITIPSSVTSIGKSAFYGCSSLTSITIPESVTSIGEIAFSNCSSLTSITIPESVTSIGAGAFSNCSSLTSITIPSSVTSIGRQAFYFCWSLTSITIPESVTSIGADAFFGCDNLTSITIPESVTSIGESAFSFCSSLTSITIPESVTSIGESAFSFCSSLSSITIPSSVTSIGQEAFYGCSSLTSITIPSSVTSIGLDVFSKCDRLTSAIIEEGTTKIVNNAFSGCSSLTSITIPESVTSIGEYAFYGCSSLTSITIPKSVTSIGAGAFFDCSSLTSITIPESVTSIGAGAFFGCSSLTSITIPESVTSIGADAFLCCSSLTSITIPESVTSIGAGAFSNCSSLTSITIPESVTSIGQEAFYGCSSLTSITIPSSVTSIGQDVFSECDRLTSAIIEEGTTKIVNNAFYGCSSLTSITIPSSVTSIGFNAFYGCSSLTSITIPSSVTSIGFNAFYGCSSLTSITIPSSVTSIGQEAFSGCSSLTSITIPSSVTSIGQYVFSKCDRLTSAIIEEGTTKIVNNAFYGCSSLTSITIPESVTSIGEYAFYGCSSLTSITIPKSVTSIGAGAFSNCSSLTSITIPESVTSIGESAFYGCSSLTSITIPESVTSIGESAFYGCSSLTSITIPSSVTSIGYNAFYGCRSLKEIYCYAEEPPYVDSYAFYNVPNDVVLYIPLESLLLYNDSEEWNRFNIKYISSDISLLELFLPIAEGEENIYKNMTLELTNNSNNQVIKHNISDKVKYSFNIENKYTYSLTLKNQYGSLLGRIDSIKVELPIDTLIFEDLLKVYDVSLKLLLPDGTDITDEVDIVWYDKEDNILTENANIKGLIEEYEMQYQITLPFQYRVLYYNPSKTTYIVNSDLNDIEITLQPLVEKEFSGSVIDEDTGLPINNASIVVSQSFNGKNASIYSAKSNSKGNFNISLIEFPAEIVIQADGYLSKKFESDDFETLFKNPIKLKAISGTSINTNIIYTRSVEKGENVIIEDIYPDYENISYSIYNKTQNREIEEYNVQYPLIVIYDAVLTGDTLQISVSSKNNFFKPISAEAVVDSLNQSFITINIIEQGAVKAHFSSSENNEVVASLYNDRGELLKSANYNSGNVSFHNIPSGEYTLVTMAESSMLNSFAHLSQLNDMNLKENTDYIRNDLVVEDGVVSVVENNKIPYLDESKWYYTGDNTKFYINKTSIGAGQYLTLNTTIDFEDIYTDKVSNISLMVDLPESVELVENSAIIGSNIAYYSLADNRMTIDLNDDNYKDRIRFCMIPTKTGEYTITGFIAFTIDGKDVVQPIGNVKFSVTGMDIIVPAIVKKREIPVGGYTILKSDIEIYDNDILIGKATPQANGEWYALCNLGDVFNMSEHEIYARIVTSDGVIIESEVKDCLYNENSIVVDKVTMYYNGYTNVFDFNDPSPIAQSYTYSSNTSFTFTISFSENDPEKVSFVVLNVKTMDNEWIPLNAEYNEERGMWVASASRNQLKGSYPINVSVEYLSYNEYILERAAVEKSMEDTEYEIDLLKKEMKEINSFFELTADENTNIDIYELIEKILAEENPDYEHISQLIASIKLPDVEVEEGGETLDIDILTKEYDEWMSNFNGSGRDELLAGLFLPLSDISDFDINQDFSETLTSDENNITWSKTRLASIDEDWLINNHYQYISVDDNSKIYYLYNLDKIEFIDIKNLVKYSVDITQAITPNLKSKKTEIAYPPVLIGNCIKSYKDAFFNIKELYNNVDNVDDLEGMISYQLQVINLLSNLIGTFECIYTEALLKMEHEMDNSYKNIDNDIADKINKREIIQKRLNDEFSSNYDLLIEENQKKLLIENNLKEIEEKINSGKYSGDELKDLQKSKVDLQTKIDECKKVIKNIDSELKRINSNLKAVEKQISNLLSQRKTAKELYNYAIKNLRKLPPTLRHGIKSPKLLGNILKLAGPVATFTNYINIAYDIWTCINNIKEWIQLNQTMKAKLPCENDAVNAQLLSKDITNYNWKVLVEWLTILIAEVASAEVDKGVPTLASFSVSAALTATAEFTKLLGVEKSIYQMGEFYKRMTQLKCIKLPNDSLPKQQLIYSGSPDLKPNIDPAGYVYEGVPSNRLEGVTVTCYYKESVEDMYGDVYENIVMWNAEDYGQKNPLKTDKDGTYSWDVPQGLWQVKFEKDGYETTYSDWLPVPPPQLEVNIEMVQYTHPTVVEAVAYENAIEIEFDKYMNVNDLITDKFVITQNNLQVTASLELLNAEDAYKGRDGRYASRVRLNLSKPFSQSTVKLLVKKEIASYAGMIMESDFIITLNVIKEVKQLSLPKELFLPINKEVSFDAYLLPAESAKGKYVYATTQGISISLKEDKVMVDNNGKATFTIIGKIPGITEIDFSADGLKTSYKLTAKINDGLLLNDDLPFASLSSGSKLYKGTEVALHTNDDSKTIWYTTDGTCPCDIDGTRIKYTKPILIESDIEILAVSEDMYGTISDVSSFSYSILKNESGLSLNKGWNWVSFNIESENLKDVNNTLSSGIWCGDDEIKNAIYTDSYSETRGEWIGTLSKYSELKNSEMYKIHSSVDQNIELSGVAVNPKHTAVEVHPNWNYIAYIPMVRLSVESALSDYPAIEGDVIKSENAFAVYSEEDGWRGDLKYLFPGNGYMLRRNQNAKTLNFYYPDLLNKESDNVLEHDNIHLYSDNMNIIARIDDFEVQSGDTLIAMVKDEIRGVSAINENDSVFITIQGENRNRVNLYLKRADNSMIKANNIVDFESNLIMGSLDEPELIKFDSDEENGSVRVYPTLFENDIFVDVDSENYELISVQIYNIDGYQLIDNKYNNKYQQFFKENIDLSQIPSGVYLVKVLVDNKISVFKIIKK